MSSTFYIDGWEKTKITSVKVYLSEKYPDLDEEYFEEDKECYQRDEKGLFEMEDAYSYPFLYCHGANRAALLNALGYEDNSVSEFPNEQLSELSKKLMLFINSAKKIQSTGISPVNDGRIFDGGVSSDSIKIKAEKLLEMVLLAKKESVGIYWG